MLSYGFCCFMKHPDQKASWERKCLFDFNFHIAVHHQKKLDQAFM